MCGARFDCTVCLQSRSADLQQLSRSVTDVEKRRPEIALPDSFCVIPSFRWRCLDRRRTARGDGFALSIESSNVCYRSVSALMRSAAGAIKIDRLRSGAGQSSREIFARITGLRKRVCRTGQPNEKKGGSTTSGRSTSAEDPNSAKVIPAALLHKQSPMHEQCVLPDAAHSGASALQLSLRFVGSDGRSRRQRLLVTTGTFTNRAGQADPGDTRRGRR